MKIRGTCGKILVILNKARSLSRNSIVSNEDPSCRLCGFWSYSRAQEDASGRLLKVVQGSLREAFGRHPEVEIFRDVNQAPGTHWPKELVSAIRRSVLFFWLQSPRYLDSELCRFELEMFQAQVSRIAHHFGVPGNAELLFEHWIVPIRWQNDHEANWPSRRSNPATREIANLWDELQLHSHCDIARHGHSEASYRENGIAMGTMIRNKLYDSLKLLGGDGTLAEQWTRLLAFVSQEANTFESNWRGRMPVRSGPHAGGKSGWGTQSVGPYMKEQGSTYDLALTSSPAQEALCSALADAFRSQEALRELAAEMGTSSTRSRELLSNAVPLIEEARQNSALRRLLCAARALQPGNEQLIAFEARYTRRCYDRGVGTADQVRRLDALIGIIACLGDDVAGTVTDAFEAVAGGAVAGKIAPRWNMGNVSTRVNLAVFVGRIAELDDADSPPLFRFVQEIQRRTQDETLRTSLKEWLRNTGAGPDKARPQLAAASPEPPYVMVRMKPLSQDYCLTIWVWVDGYPPKEPEEVWSSPCRSLDDLRDVLARELGHKDRPLMKRLRGVPPDRITFEFILPSKLIDAEVDRWEIAVSGEFPLGAVHRVVVRSYERIYAMPDNYWTARWNVWESRAALPPVWFDPSTDQMDKFKRTLRPENVVIVAVAGPFPAGANDPLRTLLRLGLPIILWARQPCSTETRKRIDALLQHINGTGDLRTALLQMRQGDEDDACLHTVLLWDDPRRCPPDLERFEAPPTEELSP